MIIFYVNDQPIYEISRGERVTIGILNNAIVFNRGTTKLTVTHRSDDKCFVEALDIAITLNGTRIRNGAKHPFTPDMRLRVQGHEIRFIERKTHEHTGMSLPGAPPREEVPPNPTTNQTYVDPETVGDEDEPAIPSPLRVVPTAHNESDDDPPTDRQPKSPTPVETPTVEVDWLEIAKDEFAQAAKETTTLIENEAVKTLQTIENYSRVYGGMSILALVLSLAAWYKTNGREDAPIDTHPVVAETVVVKAPPEPPRRTVFVRDLRESAVEAPTLESEQAPYEPRTVEAITGDTSEIAPPPDPPSFRPITVKLTQTRCNENGCSFWARQDEADDLLIWRGEKIRDGACDNGEPCIVFPDGRPVPRSCLSTPSTALETDCPQLEVLARVE